MRLIWLVVIGVFLFGLVIPSVEAIVKINGPGSIQNFLDLLDTPATYAGSGSECVKVNAGATVLEFGACAVGGQSKAGSGYLFNNSVDIFLNDTKLNATIRLESLNGSEADSTYLNLSGTNADQNMDVGIFNFTGSYFLGSTLTPTLPDHLVNKDYIDNVASAIAFDFFFTNISSDLVGHNNMTESDLGLPEVTITTPTQVTGTTSILNWTTELGQPEFNELRKGTYNVHIHMLKTGTKTVTITPKLYNISADGSSRNLLLTFETSTTLGLTDTEYDLHGVLSSEIILSSGDRLNLELEATIGAAGSDPTISVHAEGTTDSHLSIETSSNAFEQIFLRQDGTKPLTSNWDAGLFNITAQLFKGTFNWTVLSNYLTFDGALLTLDDTQIEADFNQTGEINSVNTTLNIENLGFTQGVHTTDTNETSRMENLTGEDCSAGTLVIGVQANGTVLCATDTNIDTNFTGGGTLYGNLSGEGYNSTFDVMFANKLITDQLTVNGQTVTSSSTLMLESTGVFSFESTSNVNIPFTFVTSGNDGQFDWRNVEDYFFSFDDWFINAGENIFFRDTEINISSPNDGQLSINSDVSINITTPTFRLTGNLTQANSSGADTFTRDYNGSCWVEQFGNNRRIMC